MTRSQVVRASLFTAFLFLLARGASAETLLAYNLQGNAGTEISEPAAAALSGITGINLTRGSGLTASSASNGFAASGWENAAASNPADDTDFFELGFTVAPNSLIVSVDQFLVGTRSSGTGPGSMGVYASIDGGAYELITTLAQPNAQFLNSAIDINRTVTSSLIIRFIQVGNTSANGGTTAAAGTFRLTNYFAGTPAVDSGSLRFTGSVRPVPEPSSIVLIGLGSGLMGLALHRRVRKA